MNYWFGYYRKHPRETPPAIVLRIWKEPVRWGVAPLVRNAKFGVEGNHDISAAEHFSTPFLPPKRYCPIVEVPFHLFAHRKNGIRNNNNEELVSQDSTFLVPGDDDHEKK